jgi:hypothetical protein
MLSGAVNESLQAKNNKPKVASSVVTRSVRVLRIPYVLTAQQCWVANGISPRNCEEDQRCWMSRIEDELTVEPSAAAVSRSGRKSRKEKGKTNERQEVGWNEWTMCG